MSKLPRLSNSAQSDPASQPDSVAADPDSPIQNTTTSTADPSPAALPSMARMIPAPAMTTGMLMSAEVWISAVLGIIFMLVGRNFAAYCIARMMGHPYHTNVLWLEGTALAGTEVAYPDLTGFVMLTDASVILFGLAMVFEAIVLFASGTSRGLRRPLITTAFAVTLLAVGFNLFTIARVLNIGGMPMMSLMATAFGVYIAMYEWALLKSTGPAARESS